MSARSFPGMTLRSHAALYDPIPNPFVNVLHAAGLDVSLNHPRVSSACYIARVKAKLCIVQLFTAHVIPSSTMLRFYAAQSSAFVASFVLSHLTLSTSFLHARPAHGLSSERRKVL